MRGRPFTLDPLAESPSEPNEGGGAGAGTGATGAAQGAGAASGTGTGTGAGNPPTTTPSPTPADPMLARLAALEAENATFRAEQATRAQQAAAAERERLARAGQIDQLVANHQRDLAERDRVYQEHVAQTRRLELRRSLVESLAAHGGLLPQAVSQLSALWSGDFEVVDGPNNEPIARSRTDFRPVAAVIAERLASADFAHFLAATHRGGAAQGGANPQPNAGGVETPTDPEAALFARFRANREQQATGPVWARDFLSGLRRSGSGANGNGG